MFLDLKPLSAPVIAHGVSEELDQHHTSNLMDVIMNVQVEALPILGALL